MYCSLMALNSSWPAVSSTARVSETGGEEGGYFVYSDIMISSVSQVKSLLATIMLVSSATYNCPANHGPGRERGYRRKPYEANLFPIMLATFSSPPFCLPPSLAKFICHMPTHQQALLSFRVLPPYIHFAPHFLFLSSTGSH